MLLIDYRLYLPAGWTEDTKRLNRAKVPQDQRAFKTKPELAREIIETAKARSSRHRAAAEHTCYRRTA